MSHARLRLLVSERLHAAAEEILQVFEKVIEKYEQEAAVSQEVISRQHALICQLHKSIREQPPADVFTEQLSVHKATVLPEHQHQDQHQHQHQSKHQSQHQDQNQHQSQHQDQHHEDPPREQEVVGELDEAEIIKFTYSSRCSGASGSAEVLVLSSSEAETEDSEDYNRDPAETGPAQTQQSGGGGGGGDRRGSFSCRVCGRMFRIRRLLFRHATAHLQEDEAVCGVCGEKPETCDGLKHMRTHLATWTKTRTRTRTWTRRKRKGPEPGRGTQRRSARNKR